MSPASSNIIAAIPARPPFDSKRMPRRRYGPEYGQHAKRPIQSPIAAAARLQVSGAATSISIDVERSDVQSALKAVLKQAVSSSRRMRPLPGR